VGQVLMLDLDVHQGDGSATIFAGAQNVRMACVPYQSSMGECQEPSLCAAGCWTDM
jgi:acetoin utilization deacetylase AcuC-like enzyme